MLKKDDRVELDGQKYRVSGCSGHWYLIVEGTYYQNEIDKIFTKYKIDKQVLQKEVLGYSGRGLFPECNTLKDLTKFVDAIRAKINYVEYCKSARNSTDFKKGEYVVLLAGCNGGNTWKSNIPINHIYCLREDSHSEYFKVDKDINGSTTNGWSSENYGSGSGGSKLELRLATEQEIAMFKDNDGPCDVTTYKMKSKVKKWDIGTYAVVIKDGEDNIGAKKVNKGQILQLTHTKFSDDTLGVEGYDYCIETSLVKWFATIEEANAFSRELLGEPKKEKFKVGNWVVGWHMRYKTYQTVAWRICKVSSRFVYTTHGHCTVISDIRKATLEEILKAKGLSSTPTSTTTKQIKTEDYGNCKENTEDKISNIVGRQVRTRRERLSDSGKKSAHICESGSEQSGISVDRRRRSSGSKRRRVERGCI